MMLEIVDYRPEWPAEYEAIAAEMEAAFGDLAVRIDHIGSTAVPGLAAKDIIDVQITVRALEPAVAAALAGIGYTRPEGMWRDHVVPGFDPAPVNWEKWYFHEPAGQRMTNTHVRVDGRPNQRYPLLFRDYLRAHPATAEAYGELKRRLAAHLADPQQYTYVKDPAVDLIYLAAEEWATRGGWQP